MQFTDWTDQSVNYHIALKAMFYLLNEIGPPGTTVTSCNVIFFSKPTLNMKDPENIYQWSILYRLMFQWKITDFRAVQ